jgi:hypothetical protein
MKLKGQFVKEIKTEVFLMKWLDQQEKIPLGNGVVKQKNTDQKPNKFLYKGKIAVLLQSIRFCR